MTFRLTTKQGLDRPIHTVEEALRPDQFVCISWSVLPSAEYNMGER